MEHCSIAATKKAPLFRCALRSEADSNIKPQGLLSPRECRCRIYAVRRYTTEVTAAKGEQCAKSVAAKLQSSAEKRRVGMGLAPMNTLCFSAMEHRSIAATKKAPLFRDALRSEADSNRCTRFCRPLPSHSAIRPFLNGFIRLGVQI